MFIAYFADERIRTVCIRLRWIKQMSLGQEKNRGIES